MFMVFIIGLSSISAWNTNTFNNSLSTENLSLSNFETITRYLEVPSGVYLLKAYLNLSGINYTIAPIVITSNSSHTFSTDPWVSPMNSSDKNWVTRTSIFGGGVYYLYQNFTHKRYPENITCGIGSDNIGSGTSMILYNYTSNSYIGLFDKTDAQGNFTYNITPDNVREGIIQMAFTHGAAPYTAYVWECQLSSQAINNVSNVNISIGGKQIYYYPNNLTHQNNKTDNFYSVINNYLSSCSYISSKCYVPINFKSASYGILQYSDLIFNNEGFTEISQNYSSQVLEYSTNEFLINISFNSDYYTSANAYLVYDNIPYSANKIGTGNNITFSKKIVAPSVSANINKTFYWTISLNGASNTEYYNSTAYNQTILNLIYGTCNATNTIRIFNFTTYGEDNRNQLITPNYNNTYAIDMKIGSQDLSSYLQYSTNTSGNSFAICSNISLIGSLRVDYTLLYGSTSHVSEYYNVQNYSLTNLTLSQNISLYPLLTTSSQEFLIKLKDSNYIPLQNSVIEIYRTYVDIGTTKLVEAPLSDSLGQTIGHFVTNDVLYDIYIKKDGQLIGSFNDVQVYCNVALTDCILNLNLYSSATSPTSFLDYLGISYLPTYNQTTRKYSLSFTSVDSSDKTIEIYGFDKDSNLVCSNTITGTSGNALCDMSSLTKNQTILINAYVDDELLFSDFVSVSYSIRATMGNIRYILVAFIIPFLVMFALSSGAIAIIIYMIGLIFAVGIFALDTQSVIGAGSFIVWLVVAGIILIIKIMRGGVKNG